MNDVIRDGISGKKMRKEEGEMMLNETDLRGDESMSRGLVN